MARFAHSAATSALSRTAQLPDADNNLDDSVVLELTVYPVESQEACEFPGFIAGHTSWYTGPMF